MGEDKALARYAAEFTGTFVLVATVCGNVLSNQNYWGGFSIACALAVMVFALGKSSGAHFNPAVTIALLAADKFPLREVPFYLGSQCAGGLLAAILSMELYLGKTVPVRPLGEFVWWQAALAEVFYTVVLAFVVLNVAASQRHAGRSQFYGIAIGFVIAAGAYGAGSVSGGCFNPAVAMSLEIGSAIHAARAPTWYFAVYAIAELIGGLLAAALYRVVRAEEYNNMPDLEERLPGIAAKLLSEFLGTFTLVLTVSLNVLTGSPATAFSIAASLMVMIFALGTISGAHLNPAVTVAVLIAGRNKISQREAGMYMAVQCLAGLVAGRAAWLFTSFDDFVALKPESSTWVQALCAEIFYTTVLAFVVLSVATVKNPLSEYFGFSIGMCVTVGGCAIGSISGGSLNPAVSIGIAFSSKGSNIWQFIPYGLVECFAGALAVGLFKITQPSEFEDDSAQGAQSEGQEEAVEEGLEKPKNLGPDDIHLSEAVEARDFIRPGAGSRIPEPVKPAKLGRAAKASGGSGCRCFPLAG